MWPFKSKNKPEFKPKYKISYRKIKVNVGMTDVLVTFEDGRNFVTYIRGQVYNYTDEGLSHLLYSEQRLPAQVREPVVGETKITRSKDVAKTFILNLNELWGSTLVNYPDGNHYRSATGKPVYAEIGSSADYEIDYMEPFLEEIK